MAAKNLRILYNNLSNAATITPSTTRGVTSVNYLKKDVRGLVWQSTSKSATLNLDWSAPQIVSCVVLVFTNLTSTSTIRVQGYLAGSPVLDTGVKLAVGYADLGGWGEVPLGLNSYSYTGGSYARIYFPHITVDELLITLEDPDNTQDYLEVSRLLTGSHWSPIFNHPYGASYNYVDTSSNQRMQSADLVSSRGVRYNTVSFSLDYMQKDDRLRWNSLTKICGSHTPLFVSLYPEDDDPEKEQSYQVYGKLTGITGVTHRVYTMYSTQVTVEEI